MCNRHQVGKTTVLSPFLPRSGEYNSFYALKNKRTVSKEFHIIVYNLTALQVQEFLPSLSCSGTHHRSYRYVLDRYERRDVYLTLPAFAAILSWSRSIQIKRTLSTHQILLKLCVPLFAFYHPGYHKPRHKECSALDLLHSFLLAPCYPPLSYNKWCILAHFTCKIFTE